MVAPLHAPARVTLDEALARVVGGHRTGPDRGAGRCPVHGGHRTDSLSVREVANGTLIFWCFGAQCDYYEILDALGLAPCQVGGRCRTPCPCHSTSGGWSERERRPRRARRVRRDPDREARATLERLSELRELPPPAQMRDELRGLGRLIRGGAATFARVPADFDADKIRTAPLRLLFLAIRQLAREGTPRHSFPPRVLAGEIALHGGDGWEAECWARLALEIALYGADGREGGGFARFVRRMTSKNREGRP